MHGEKESDLEHLSVDIVEVYKTSEKKSTYSPLD